MIYGQISFDDLMQENRAKEAAKELTNIRSVGDRVGRVVLGELRTGRSQRWKDFPFIHFTGQIAEDAIRTKRDSLIWKSSGNRRRRTAGSMKQ